jgi:hypothetical protein
MESHKAGFPPFPHSLEIPSGFPHSHGLGDWIYVFSCSLNSNHRHRKGLVTDVSGPQRNACPGTLTPLSRSCCCFCSSDDQGRRCGQDTGLHGWGAENAGKIGGCSGGRAKHPSHKQAQEMYQLARPRLGGLIIERTPHAKGIEDIAKSLEVSGGKHELRPS